MRVCVYVFERKRGGGEKERKPYAERNKTNFFHAYVADQIRFFNELPNLNSI